MILTHACIVGEKKWGFMGAVLVVMVVEVNWTIGIEVRGTHGYEISCGLLLASPCDQFFLLCFSLLY